MISIAISLSSKMCLEAVEYFPLIVSSVFCFMEIYCQCHRIGTFYISVNYDNLLRLLDT